MFRFGSSESYVYNTHYLMEYNPCAVPLNKAFPSPPHAVPQTYNYKRLWFWRKSSSLMLLKLSFFPLCLHGSLKSFEVILDPLLPQPFSASLIGLEQSRQNPLLLLWCTIFVVLFSSYPLPRHLKGHRRQILLQARLQTRRPVLKTFFAYSFKQTLNESFLAGGQTSSQTRSDQSK